MQDLSPYARMAQRPSRYASHVITITSQTAVGSSTTLKQLQQTLGVMLWRYVSAGAIMRTFAEQKKMTIEEFAAHNRAHPEEGWDEKCDSAVQEFGRQNYTVIEGRLPHVFVPHAFHVLLHCDLTKRAERRARDYKAVWFEVRALIGQRDQDDRARYERLYPGCLWPARDYDLVLDTGALSPEEIGSAIVHGHKSWREELKGRGLLCEEIMCRA